MNTKIQRTLTAENLEESRKLRALWDERSNRMTQAEFGEVFDVGSQAAVGHFLNGKAAISLKAAKGFALGLDCEISAFSERLAGEASALGEVAGNAPQLDLTSLNRDELRMLLIFRQLEVDGQRRMTEFGTGLLAKSTTASAEPKRATDSNFFAPPPALVPAPGKTRTSSRSKQKA